MNVQEFIRQRTRQEWRELLFSRYSAARIWVQDHGELSLLFGAVGGVILVLFFRLIFFLFVLALLIAYLFWFLAPADKSGPVN